MVDTTLVWRLDNIGQAHRGSTAGRSFHLLLPMTDGGQRRINLADLQDSTKNIALASLVAERIEQTAEPGRLNVWGQERFHALQTWADTWRRQRHAAEEDDGH